MNIAAGRYRLQPVRVDERSVAGLAAATVALGLVASTPALGTGEMAKPDAQRGTWRGTSDQAVPIDFDVAKSGGHLVVEPQDVEVIATCEVTGDEMQLGFGGGQIRLHPDGTFKMRFYDAYFGDLRWSGTLGDTKGTGIISFTLGGLLKNDMPQLCPSGDVSWKAHAVGFGSASPRAGHPDYRVHVSRDRSGRLTWTVTKG